MEWESDSAQVTVRLCRLSRQAKWGLRTVANTFRSRILILAMISTILPVFSAQSDDAASHILDYSSFGDTTLNFDDYKLVTDRMSECKTALDDKESSPTYGGWQYMCTADRISHGDDGHKLRFKAQACRTGSTVDIARFKSLEAVHSMILQDYLDANHVLKKQQEWKSDRQTDDCNLIWSPVMTDFLKSMETEGEKSASDDLGSSTKTMPARSQSLPNPTKSRFRLRNLDRYSLGLEFYSQSSKNAWPGGGRQYVLGKEGVYDLSCHEGEKICFGAWRNGQDVSWGAGRRNEEGCSNCCTVCGSNLETTLPDAGIDKGPPPAVFIIHNHDHYTLGIKFFAREGNRVWPGRDRKYTVTGTDTYRLSCQAGEKICFGAWRDGQTTYWGVGHEDEHGCSNCCVICGGLFETTLKDGGAASFPVARAPSRGSTGTVARAPSEGSVETGGSSSVANDVLGLLGAVLEVAPAVVGAMGSTGLSSQPTFRPAPRQRGSDITGTNR